MKKLIEIGYDQFGIVVAKKYLIDEKEMIDGDLTEVWRWEKVSD